MDKVKAYRPESNSFSNGQVLSTPYTVKKARVVILEMADAMTLNLVEKRLVTDQIVVSVGYDAENMTNPAIRAKYQGPVVTDRYGRQVPKHAHGTVRFDCPTSSSRLILEQVSKLFDRIVNPDLLIRYLNISVGHVIDEKLVNTQAEAQQLDLFADYEAEERKRQEENATLEKERRLQEAQLAIKRRFGKNAILKGLNFEDGATARERNKQIGGHKA